MNIKQNTTRIIGIILLIISILFIKYINKYAVFLIIPAIIMILAANKTAQKEFTQLLSTFRQLKGKKFYLVAMYDTLSWFIFAAAAYTIGAFMNRQITGEIMGPEMMLSVLKISLAYLAFTTILTIVIYSVFKGLIWLTILNKKIELRFFTRFCILNLAWWLILLVPTAAVLIGTKPGIYWYAFGIWLVLYIHLTTVLQYSFAEKQRIGFAIKNAFTTGLGKIKRFLLPGSYAATIYFVLINIFWIVPLKYINFIGVLVLVFYLAWYRIYMAGIIAKTT